jgi:hypothetical protein
MGGEVGGPHQLGQRRLQRIQLTDVRDQELLELIEDQHHCLFVALTEHAHQFGQGRTSAQRVGDAQPRRSFGERRLQRLFRSIHRPGVEVDDQGTFLLFEPGVDQRPEERALAQSGLRVQDGQRRGEDLVGEELRVPVAAEEQGPLVRLEGPHAHIGSRGQDLAFRRAGGRTVHGVTWASWFRTRGANSCDSMGMRLAPRRCQASSSIGEAGLRTARVAAWAPRAPTAWKTWVSSR